METTTMCKEMVAQSSDEEEENPEQLLNEWLGELDILTAGLDSVSSTTSESTQQQILRPLSHEIAVPRIDSYRFSMANLEDSQDVDLDAILGELCALETRCNEECAIASSAAANKRSSQSVENRPIVNTGFGRTHTRNCSDGTSIAGITSHRTDSPDNDSAFSDTVSMLSSESSASSGASAGMKNRGLNLEISKDSASQLKAQKIRLALEKMKDASVKKLFIKAFSVDGSSKSLLVDEKMTCGYIARLLADKNHVTMEPKWAIVEHLTDLYMERVYEDHEFLVENLMLWTRESKNKIIFMERPEKVNLFQKPENFLICDATQNEQDEHARNVLIEEFFNQSINMQPPVSHSIATMPNYTGNAVPPLEGPLYLKSDSKKGWKRYHFVMRSSGLYYYPKEKVKTLKELVCLTTFDVNEIYLGINWKKKYKAPTDFCFAIKHPRLQQPKSVKYIKFFCADDRECLEKWIVAMRIAKHGRQLLDNYRSLVDDLAQEDLDHLAEARSCSVASIAPNSGSLTPQQTLNSPESSKNQPIYSTRSIAGSSDISSGRHSCASSSSSSGCMSDGPSESEGNAFDSEFPMGTIKRKPSMKPNIPLTSMTRQLKEMVDLATSSSQHSINSDHSSNGSLNSSGYTNSGTLTRRHSRRKSNQTIISEDGNNTDTLKKSLNKGSLESMNSSRTSSSGCNTPTLSTPISGNHTDCLKENNYSGFYKSPKGEILPNSGILLGYITSQKVINGNANHQSKEIGTWNNAVNQYNRQLNTTPTRSENELKNNYYFSSSMEDLEDMPLPAPPHETTINSTNSTLDSMFSSTFSLDSLPPPPPPVTDDHTLEGYDLTGSQLSLVSLPPPPLPLDEYGRDEITNRNIQKLQNETSKVNVSEIVNQLSSNISQLNKRDSNNSINRNLNLNNSVQQNSTLTNNQRLSKQSLNSSSSFGSEQSSSGSITGNLSKFSNNSLNSQVYATCVAEIQMKNSNTPSPSVAKKVFQSQQATTEKPLHVFTKSVSFADVSPEKESPIMLRRQNSSIDQNMILTVPCSPNKKNKKISFVIPGQIDCISSPPCLPNKPPPPRRCESTRLSSPKKLSDSTSNPPKDFIKDLQRVMKKKWQVAQKCKLEPTTTPHEVLGFREFPYLTEDYKEANVSNWVQEHYGHIGQMAKPDNLYENINKSQDIVEYATSCHVNNRESVGSGSCIQRGGDNRMSVSKKRPPPPPPKRSETTQLTTLPIQKLR